MKYAYQDLGTVSAGSAVMVNVHGAASGVLLLSAANFLRYRTERSFGYTGGRYRGRPVRIMVPRDDHWFVVLELGTYNGRAHATVEVLPPGGAKSSRRQKHALAPV